MNKLIGVVLFPLVILSVGLAWCLKTPGFSVDKISSSLEPRREWATLQTNQEEISQIASQPFHYLAQGAQCYAFASEDGKWVIKFFKMKHLLPKFWMTSFPFSLLFPNYYHKKVEVRRKRLSQTFESCKLAYEQLKEETGLVAVHLNKTHNLSCEITLVAKGGRRFKVDLDRVEFVLQKKALGLHDYLRSQDAEGKKKAVAAIEALIAKRCQLGLGDLDQGVSRNYGFVGDLPIHLDMAGLVKDERLKDPKEAAQEIERVIKKVLCSPSYSSPSALPDAPPT
jgi:hypothetical protein